MPDICPECEAALQNGVTCQSIFDDFLVLEFTDPEYGAVHFLTVACFMIQHGRYSDEGLIWIEKRLRDHLEKGVPVDQIRRQAAGEANQSIRKWNIIRRPGDSPQMKIAWTMTIGDVASKYHDAASYRAFIQQWGRSILAEMKPLIPKS